jgi:HAD superfamily hydrolase (TIGR01484 family)
MTTDRDETAPIVCFDFDGTLVDAEGRIHPSDVAILGAAIQATLVPATGRPLHAVRSTLVQHGLFADRPLPFSLVLEGGAVVYDAGERVRAEFAFDPDVQHALTDAMLAAPRITFLVFSTDRVFELWPSEPGDRMIDRFALQTAPFAAEQREMPWTKVVSIARTPDPLREFATGTSALPLERAFSLPTVLELTRAGVDKGLGLDVLLDCHKPHGTIAAAGDGENDLPLFDRATVTFAPADSPPTIRARADHVFDPARGVLTPILRTLGLLSNNSIPGQ